MMAMTMPSSSEPMRPQKATWMVRKRPPRNMSGNSKMIAPGTRPTPYACTAGTGGMPAPAGSRSWLCRLAAVVRRGLDVTRDGRDVRLVQSAPAAVLDHLADEAVEEDVHAGLVLRDADPIGLVR